VNTASSHKPKKREKKGGELQGWRNELGYRDGVCRGEQVSQGQTPAARSATGGPKDGPKSKIHKKKS